MFCIVPSEPEPRAGLASNHIDIASTADRRVPFADPARFAFAEKSQLLKKLPCRKTATSTNFTAYISKFATSLGVKQQKKSSSLWHIICAFSKIEGRATS